MIASCLDILNGVQVGMNMWALSFMMGKYVNILKCLFQVAPYERPALSKGFLLPEGKDSPQGTNLWSGYFESWISIISILCNTG